MVLSSWPWSLPVHLMNADWAPGGHAPTLRPSQLTWTVSPPIHGCYQPHPPSPFVIITQPESWYSFYRPTEGGRLSRPSRRCSEKGSKEKLTDSMRRRNKPEDDCQEAAQVKPHVKWTSSWHIRSWCLLSQKMLYKLCSWEGGRRYYKWSWDTWKVWGCHLRLISKKIL